MNLQDLKTELDTRFDRLDDKLDKYAELVHNQQAELAKVNQDVAWLKGSIKMGLTVGITFISAAFSWIISHLKL